MGIRRASKFTAYGNPWVGKKWTALGTSITSGGQYSTPLATLLGATLTNVAVSGATIANSGGSTNGSISTQVGLVAVDADLVTIEAGINDFRLDAALGAMGDTTIATFYGAVWKANTDLLAVNTGRVIVWFTPYGNADTTYAGKWNTPNNNGVRIEQFVRAIYDVARAFGPNVRVIDVFSKSGIGGPSAAAMMSDNIHLNTFGGNVYAQYVARELAKLKSRDLHKVRVPTFSPVSGSSTAVVAITSGTSGASIYYTTDGSTPTTASTLYTGSIALSADATIKAIAVKAGLYDSDVATASYTYAPPANTWDPVGVGSTITMSNGNLDVVASTSNWGTARTIIKKSSGKFYGEVKIVSIGGSNFCMFGIADDTTSSPGSSFLNFTNSLGWFLDNALYSNAGVSASAGNNPVTGMPSRAVNDVIGIAVDLSAKKLWISHNGTFYNSQDPGAGTGAAATWTATISNVSLAVAPYNGFKVTYQQTLNYSPPSGFSQWA